MDFAFQAERSFLMVTGIRSYNNSKQFLQLQSNKLVLKLLGARQNNLKDIYIANQNPTYGIYTKQAEKDASFSSTILDAINFGYASSKESATSFTYGGVEYLKSEIPDVDESRCSEIKANNNEIVFNVGSYYKFTDKNGETHVLSCAYDCLSQPYSETSTGKQNDTSYQVGKFWNLLSMNGTYMSLYYSTEVQRKLLNDAGITEGFFSVRVGTHKQEYYYTNDKAGATVSKTHYDETYNMFMNRKGILDEFAVGSVFKIGGKEYILDENKKLDIPYGADIYDIEYPPKESAQRNEGSYCDADRTGEQTDQGDI
jgi:hypothetical protein